MPPAGLLFGLAAAGGWGLTDVTAAVVGRRVPPLVLTFAAQSTGLAMFLVVLAFTGTPLTLLGAPDAALFGAVAAVGYVAAFSALRTGPLAVVSPVIASSGAVVVVLAVLFRGEAPSPFDWLGVLLATAGVVLVAVVHDGTSRPRLAGPGVAFALVANAGFAIAIVGLAAPIQTAGWLPVTVISRAANVVTVVVLLLAAAVIARPQDRPGSERPRLRGPRVATVSGILGVGLFDALATISFSVGLETSETWLVGLSSSFGPALAVVFAVAVLGERLRPVQWAGLAALVVAVLVLALPV